MVKLFLNLFAGIAPSASDSKHREIHGLCDCYAFVNLQSNQGEMSIRPPALMKRQQGNPPLAHLESVCCTNIR